MSNTISKHGLNAYKRHGCRCEVCLEEYKQSRIRERLKNRRTLIKHHKIDAAPLIELYKETFSNGGNVSRLVRKWESGGITVYEADEYCMKIGLHPIEVFGATYFEGLIYEEEQYKEIYGELADV
jgi:hypothetical protein